MKFSTNKKQCIPQNRKREMSSILVRISINVIKLHYQKQLVGGVGL